jgi:protein-disulfide isomerase
MSESRLWVILERLSVVATIAIAGVVLWTLVQGRAVEPEPGLPRAPLELSGMPAEGSQEAPTVLMVFSDFECPACGRFALEVLPKIRERFIVPGRLQVAFRHFPLPIHSKAKGAGTFAECAGRQEKFLVAHDALFALGARFDEDSYLKIANETGLDSAALSDCRADTSALDKVERDLAYGRSLGVDATPTFFIGRLLDGRKMKVANRMVGARSFETFEFALDAVR